MWIDTHVHLNDERLYPQWMDYVKRARENNVISFFVVGYDWESSLRAVNLGDFDGIYPIVGVHPHDSSSPDIDNLNWKSLITEKTLAVGEIGLDYYKLYSPKDKQKEVFSKFIQFAKEVKKPIVIHCRDAWKDLIDIMKAERVWEIGGIMHSYSGSYEVFKIICEWNFLFSFSGPITYPNANNLREVVKKIPPDYLIIETDAPYLPPQSHRGKMNEPAYLPEIAQKVAELKNTSMEELSIKFRENLNRLFGRDL